MGADDGRGPVEFERFCEREYVRLVRFLSVYCGELATAEDLAQETLARVFQHWERVRGLDRPELWARRVALNLANSWHRRRRNRPSAGWGSASGDDQTERVDSDREFARLVASLSPRQRAVVVLRFYEDLSVADTAELMGVRAGTVRALSSQALDRLRATVTAEGPA